MNDYTTDELVSVLKRLMVCATFDMSNAYVETAITDGLTVLMEIDPDSYRQAIELLDDKDISHAA
jgi:hypothetical protein